jgi:hypothetical protein
VFCLLQIPLSSFLPLFCIVITVLPLYTFEFYQKSCLTYQINSLDLLVLLSSYLPSYAQLVLYKFLPAFRATSTSATTALPSNNKNTSSVSVFPSVFCKYYFISTTWYHPYLYYPTNTTYHTYPTYTILPLLPTIPTLPFNTYHTYSTFCLYNVLLLAILASVGFLLPITVLIILWVCFLLQYTCFAYRDLSGAIGCITLNVSLTFNKDPA